MSAGNNLLNLIFNCITTDNHIFELLI